MITDIDRQQHYCPTLNSGYRCAEVPANGVRGAYHVDSQTEDQADRERLIGDLLLVR
jgi:hypothetical protein